MTLAIPERLATISSRQVLKPNAARGRRPSGSGRTPTWPALSGSATTPTAAPTKQPPVSRAQEAPEGLAQFFVE
jgi:hypothetical protein